MELRCTCGISCCLDGGAPCCLPFNIVRVKIGTDASTNADSPKKSDEKIRSMIASTGHLYPPDFEDTRSTRSSRAIAYPA